jgi:hypothetical protein
VGAIAMPKNGEVDLLQVQNGNGTAIIRWRWLADPQAGGQRQLQQWGGQKVLAGRYSSRQVVYGEEVAGISRKGVKDRRRRKCVGDGQKNEETDLSEIALWRVAGQQWPLASFASRTNCRAIPP